MEHEELGQLRQSNGVVGRYEDALLGESVNNDQDRGATGGGREFLDKIHGYGIPWFLWNQELLEEFVGAMSWSLGPCTHSTRLAEVLNKGA